MRFPATTLLLAGSVMAGEGADYVTVTQTSTTLACPSSVTDCPLRNSPSTWAASNSASSSTASWVFSKTSVNVAAVTTAAPSHTSTFSTVWSGNSTSRTYKATGSVDVDWTACDCEYATSCGASWTSDSTGGVYVNGGSGSGAYGNGGSGSVGSGSGAYGNGVSGGSGSVGSGSGASGNGRSGTGVSGNGTVSISGNGTASASGIVTAGASAAAPAFLAVVAGLIAFLA
jgi:hypothetical protein